MSTAYGLEERRNTLARIRTINQGRAWQGSVPDDTAIPRDVSDRVSPYTVVDFGAPVRSARDRNLAFAEKKQPHVLPASITCIAGDYDAAQILASAVFELLVDWAPSPAADPFEAKGGFGTRRPATGATPTRYLEGLFLETVTQVNPS